MEINGVVDIKATHYYSRNIRYEYDENEKKITSIKPTAVLGSVISSTNVEFKGGDFVIGLIRPSFGLEIKMIENGDHNSEYSRIEVPASLCR